MTKEEKNIILKVWQASVKAEKEALFKWKIAQDKADEALLELKKTSYYRLDKEFSVLAWKEFSKKIT